jgi:hypothetical protein
VVEGIDGTERFESFDSVDSFDSIEFVVLASSCYLGLQNTASLLRHIPASRSTKHALDHDHSPK